MGTECASAAACLTGVISLSSVQQAVRKELAEMKASVVDRNVELAASAFNAMAAKAGIVVEGGTTSYGNRVGPNWVDMPADDIGTAMPAIFGGATSVAVRTGLWRSMRPVIDTSRCNRCTWICGSFCPDSAIVVGQDGYPQIDLDHCKGCMICVAQCPPHAIAAVPEVEATARDKEGIAP
ncbi:MAG: 4Fe-4S binding protein [Alphaproteobacteria bacterium]